MNTDNRIELESQRTREGWTRRDFVRAAGAAMLVPSVLAHGASAPRKNPVLKVGIVGCGGRGTGAAVQALRADRDVVLWAAGDIFADRLNACLGNLASEVGAERVTVAEERRFVGFDAFQKVIDSGVDVVLLTTHPVFRPQHLKAAIAAGRHVFAEKPMSVDAPGVRSVLESAAEAKRKNLSLVVGFCWRYNDGMRATFKQINDGAVGDITTVQTTYYTGTLSRNPRKPEWSDLEFQFRNWWHFTWISGDHVVEQAVHSIDRLAWATGDRWPQKVICLGGRAARSGPEHGNVFDHFSAVYEYEGGLRTFHACRQIDGCPSDNTDYVYGTKGSAVINGWVPTYHLKDRAGATLWRYAGPTDRDMYQIEHDEFFKSIRDNKPINDGERAAYTTLMALMARMSAYTGQTVSWDQALNSTEELTPKSLAWGDWPTPPVAVPGQTKFV
ncbi:Myo-inositol 2-dehydrogenase [Phycisphaerales bacterium]|nr:Myo-inositol 2-dehydrogenase [Phycisphaerales bacterium]